MIMFRFRNLLLLFFASLLIESYSQITIKSYTTATDTNYWKRYEHVPKPVQLNLNRYTARNGKSAVEAFLAAPPVAFESRFCDSGRVDQKASLRKNLFPIDLNGDQVPEIIVNGPDNGGTEMVQIYMDAASTFELIFEDYGYVSAIHTEKTGIKQLVIGDPGSRSGYAYLERSFTLQPDNGSIRFIKGLQQVTYAYTQRPSRRFDRPVPFRSANDTILIRASASFINEPYIPGLKSYGNIICGYKAFIEGNLLAAAKDGEERLWYYVEVMPGEQPHKSIFQEIGPIPTKIIGWIEADEAVAHFTKEELRRMQNIRPGR